MSNGQRAAAGHGRKHIGNWLKTVCRPVEEDADKY